MYQATSDVNEWTVLGLLDLAACARQICNISFSNISDNFGSRSCGSANGYDNQLSNAQSMQCLQIQVASVDFMTENHLQVIQIRRLTTPHAFCGMQSFTPVDLDFPSYRIGRYNQKTWPNPFRTCHEGLDV